MKDGSVLLMVDWQTGLVSYGSAALTQLNASMM